MKCIIKDNSSESRGNYLGINISNLIQPWLNFFSQKEEIESVKYILGGKGSNTLLSTGKKLPLAALQGWVTRAPSCTASGTWGHLHPTQSLVSPAFFPEGPWKDVNIDFRLVWLFPWPSRLGSLLQGALLLPSALWNCHCLVTCPSPTPVTAPQGQPWWCKHLYLFRTERNAWHGVETQYMLEKRNDRRADRLK